MVRATLDRFSTLSGPLHALMTDTFCGVKQLTNGETPKVDCTGCTCTLFRMQSFAWRDFHGEWVSVRRAGWKAIQFQIGQTSHVTYMNHSMRACAFLTSIFPKTVLVLCGIVCRRAVTCWSRAAHSESDHGREDHVDTCAQPVTMTTEPRALNSISLEMPLTCYTV